MTSIIRGNNNDIKHWMIGENEFIYNYTSYEMDLYNGRYYKLEESTCMKSDCDGKLVKRRISKFVYTAMLQACGREFE